jgi:hypothetical protein
MNVMKLIVVALAGWINQQQEGLGGCFATTPGMPHEADGSSFRTLRGRNPVSWPSFPVSRVPKLETVSNLQASPKGGAT